MKIINVKQKKIICLFSFTILLIGNVFAQKDKPNFSGTWNFDKKDSTVVLAGLDQLGLKQITFNCSIDLVIEHKEPELIIRQNSTCEDLVKQTKSLKTTETISKYFTDGRGEINTTSGNELAESKTEWNGNKIIITIYQTKKNGKKKTDLNKELNILKDKQKITIKSTPSETGVSSLFGVSFNKMVFKVSK